MDWLTKLFSRKRVSDELTPKGEEKTNWPTCLPSLDNIVRDMRVKYDRPSCLIHPDPDVLINNDLQSIIGECRVAGKNESWPEYNGLPMVGVCQINLSDAPYVSEQLAGIKFIAIYFACHRMETIYDSMPVYIEIDPPITQEDFQTKMVLRTYSTLDDLVSYENRPKLLPDIKPYGVRFELVQDPIPNYEEIHEWRETKGISDATIDHIIEAIEQSHPAHRDDHTKLGGYPALIQDPICEPLAFQLGSDREVGFMWMDSGCYFFWRDPDTNIWRFEVEFC